MVSLSVVSNAYAHPHSMKHQSAHNWPTGMSHLMPRSHFIIVQRQDTIWSSRRSNQFISSHSIDFTHTHTQTVLRHPYALYRKLSKRLWRPRFESMQAHATEQTIRSDRRAHAMCARCGMFTFREFNFNWLKLFTCWICICGVGARPEWRVNCTAAEERVQADVSTSGWLLNRSKRAVASKGQHRRWI